MIEAFFKNEEDRSRMGKALLTLAFVAVLFVGMKFINEIKWFGSVGQAPAQPNTVDISGTGESFAIPDVATAGFSVMHKGKTVKEAQDVVTKKVNDAVAFLKSAGIAETDIKTLDYSAYPEYNYPVCRDANCIDTQPKLIGYTVNQAVSVKVRDTQKVASIVEGLATAGVTGITGPDFTVDNPDGVQAEARKKAIEDAETKAKVLAKDLGVRLVRIVRFSESNGGYPSPMYAKAENSAYGMGGAADAQLPAGENKYTAMVTITYEIR